MSSGPEHYRQAQIHLDAAEGAATEEDWVVVMYCVGAAQAHATLAAAAATVLAGTTIQGAPHHVWEQWREVGVLGPKGGVS